MGQVLAVVLTIGKPRLLMLPAIENVFGSETTHRDCKYMNNRIEQFHRGTKSRYKVMKGFKCFFCALIFCTGFEEIRQLFRMKSKTRSERRRIISSKIQNFNELFTATG